MKIKLATLLMSLLVSINSWAQKHELEKSFSSNVKVREGVVLDIENKKGDIEIITWERNEISVEAEVKVSAKDESVVQEILDEIRVEIESSEQFVNVETEMDYSGLNKLVTNVHVDIVVKMPVYTNLEIENDFGDVYIEKVAGDLDVELAYGNLRVDKAEGESNEIDISFGKVFVGQISTLDIETTHATSVDISEVDVLVAKTKFSTVFVDQVRMLNLESQYDKWDVSKVDYVDVETQFSGLKLGELGKSLEIEGAYGGLNVKSVSTNFDVIKLDYSFGSAKLFFDEGVGFDFDCSTVMSSCSYPDTNTKVRKEKLNYTNYRHRGTIGAGEIRSKVDAEISQGSLVIGFK